MTNKTQPISFRLPLLTKMALEDIAHRDARSLSSLLEKMCNDLIAKDKAAREDKP